MCRSPKSQKITKNFYFESLRSVKVIDVDIPKKLVVSACYNISSMSVPICNHFHITRANSGKITPFKAVHLFRPLVRGALLNQLVARNFVTKY